MGLLRFRERIESAYLVEDGLKEKLEWLCANLFDC